MTKYPTGKLCGSIAALAALLATAATPAFAASGAAPAAHARAGHGGMHRAAHVVARARVVRNAGWGLWGYGPMVYGVPQAPDVAPVADARLTEHITYIYDVPWDAVHRYPPALRTYEQAQGCHSEEQTVPRHGGGKQAVNIIRCY